MAIADGERRVERIRVAAEVFVYGYPLVYSLRETAGFAEGRQQPARERADVPAQA